MLAGEEQDLVRLALFQQKVERGAAARIIETNERIVQHDGRRITFGQNAFADREAHGKVELVERAKAQKLRVVRDALTCFARLRGERAV